MAKSIVIIACALSCLSGLAMPAWGDDCPPLKLVNSVDLEKSPDGFGYYLPVTINGVSKRMLLDTGGDITQVTSAAAQELKLPLRDSTMRMLDATGNASKKAAVIDSFQLGLLKAQGLIVFVSPMTDLGPDVAGLVAPDLMGRYDVELDFAAGKMNYFSPDHCEGRVIYWPAQAGAKVHITTFDRKIQVPVVLDGKHLNAEIDTGSVGTIMLAPLAKRAYGLIPDSPGGTPLGTYDGERAFGHVFDNLTFEGVTIHNPHVAIVPDRFGSKDPDNINELGSNIRREDDNIDRPGLVIGMDVLRQLHLYIAFKEGNLYVTPAASPAAAKP